MLNINRSRPLGITIIAIIMAIYGLWGIISGIILMPASGALGAITLILSVLELVLAWGLWSLQRWTYWTAVILEALALLDGVFTLIQGSAASGVISLVIALIILVYLLADPNVRGAFRT